MAKRQPLDDAQLLSAIQAEEQAAISTLQGDVASDRTDAIDRYLGKAYGDEIAGRSSVVSRDVADVIEGIIANVIKPFVAGDRIVQFDPRGPEDEEAAQQETDYVNYVALERNNGFLTMVASTKDAMLLRNGYIRCSWATREDVLSEMYRGMSADELAILAQDETVEIAEHSEYLTPEGESLHDVRVRRKSATEFVESVPWAPDRILVSDRCATPSVQEADFVQLREHLSLSKLREMGYDVADDISDDDDAETLEEQSRQRFGSTTDVWEDESGDPSRRLVLFKESFIRIDRDGDGKAELRRVCTVGVNILADEECDLIPVACFTGTLMAHQHLGLSIYDQIVDLARAKTALLRQFLDNKYLANNARTAVDFNRVNLDDLLVSRPGGIVRVDGPPGDAMFPLVSPDTGPSAIAGLEYLDSVRENRTGYTRYAQGMGSDSLVNKTATGLMQATTQSQARLEMIARTIAETGVRDWFRIIHALTLKHATKAEKVKLRNKWVPIDPRAWVKRTDLSISVGLGVGSSEQQFAKLMALAPMIGQAAAQGMAGPTEVYNFAAELVKTAGFKNPDRFVRPPPTDPQTGQPQIPPPPDDPLVASAKVKAQADQQKVQAEMQADAQKFQAEQIGKQQEMAAQAQIKERELTMQYELQRSNDERQLALDREKFQQQMQLEREKALLEAQTRIEVAKIARNVDEGLESATQSAQTASQAIVGLSEQFMQTLQASLAAMQSAMQAHAQAMAQHAQAVSAPKRIVRDPSGRAVGVEMARTLQ